MKVMLLIPPSYEPTMPSLAVPCLSAVLREAGHEVIIKDVNIESYDYFLSSNGLLDSFETLNSRMNSLKFLGVNKDTLDNYIKRFDNLVNEIDYAKNGLKDPSGFYNYSEYYKNMGILEEALGFISAAYFRTRLSLNYFKSAYCPTSTDQIMKAVKDRMCNPYIEFFEKHTITDIIKASPEVIGISIAFDSQVIPGLTLAYMIKKALKNIHIVVGGSFVTFLKDKIATNKTLFSLFDSVIISEGETALKELVSRLENGKDLNGIPNLIYKDGCDIVSTGIGYVENLNELPTPCFDGLPLDLYLAPHFVIPLYTSRGCYWGKCSFCNFDISSGSSYRVRPASKVVKDIENLIGKFNSNRFIFVDEATSYKFLDRFSDDILQKSLDIYWVTHTRFEKQLTKDLLNKVSKAGCRALAFGLESASERILSLMNKGTDTVTMARILKDSREAGIRNHVSFMFGFPTETPEDAELTIKFVLDNIANISSMIHSYFLLKSGSGAYVRPEGYNIEKIHYDEHEDMSICFEYDLSCGITQKEAAYICKELSNMFSEVGYDMMYCYAALYSFKGDYKSIIWFKNGKEMTPSDDELMKQDAMIKLKRMREVLGKLKNGTDNCLMFPSS